MGWTRPADLPLGQVWKRFKGREIQGQPARTYQIRDMEEKYEDKCIEFMRDTFLRDEPLCKLVDLKSDPESIKTVICNWRGWLAQNVSLACFTEVDGEPEELVAFNVLYVKTVDDEEDPSEVKGEAWKKILHTLDLAEKRVDVFQHYKVDKYLTSSGLTVLPGHRGQNIGARMFEAREPLCRALNIKVSCTVFTADTSQTLARKCGYELLATLHYSEMSKLGIDLTGCETEKAEVRGIQFTV